MRLAIWMLAVVLAFSQNVPAIAQDSSNTSSSVTSSSSQTSSNSNITSFTVGSLTMPSMPQMGDILNGWAPDPDEGEDLPNWYTGESLSPDPDSDDDVNETPVVPTTPEEATSTTPSGTPDWNPDPDPDDDVNETPSIPTTPTTTSGSSGSGTGTPTGTPSGSGTTGGGSQTATNSTEWWSGLIPSTNVNGSNSQTVQSILDYWKTYWSPTQQGSITTGTAGSGQSTGGITSTANETSNPIDDQPLNGSTSPSDGSVAPLTGTTTPLSEGNGCDFACDGSSTSTPTSTADASVVNDNNNTEGQIIGEEVVQTDTSVDTDQVSVVSNLEIIASDSGNNTLEFSQRGEGGITTGNANSTAEGDFQLNTTAIKQTGEVQGDQVGCSDCWSVWNLGSASNNNTSEDSLNESTADVHQDFTITNTKLAYLGNEYLVSSNTGRNTINAGFSFKDGWVTTGNALLTANVINKVNTNIIDLPGIKSIWRPLVLNISGEYEGDIDLFELLAAQFGGTRGIGSYASNSNTGEDSVNIAATTFEENIDIENYSEGLIENYFTTEAVTGQNKITAGNKVKRTNLKTGKADSIFNLFSFLNTNIIGSEASVIALNITGNFKGNILLPDFSTMIGNRNNSTNTSSDVNVSNAGEDSLNQAIAITTSDQEVTVQKWAGVNSQIRNRSNTGSNVNIFGDEVEGLTVKTGKALTQTNVDTLANLSCIGCGLFMGSFNILGNWTGSLAGLPSHARKEGNGSSFVVKVDDVDIAGNANGSTVSAQTNIDGTGEDSLNGSLAVTERNVTIKNTSIGLIDNQIDAVADTGTNQIAALDGKDILVDTGDARSGVNVSSLVNTDIIGGKLVKLAINLFGSWDGNFIVGTPTDLSVSLAATPSPSPAVAGGTILYSFTVSNPADGHDTDATVVLTFDHAKTAVVNNGGGSVSGNTVTYQFDNLAAGSSAQGTLSVQINSTLGAGTHTLSASVKATAAKGDNNEANNNKSVSTTVQVATSGGSSGSQGGDNNTQPGGDNTDNDGDSGSSDEGTVGGATNPGDNSGTNGSGNDNSGNTGNTSSTSNGTSGSSVGSGASSGGSGGSTNDIFTITKSNTAPASGVKPGSTVPFKITLQNNRSVVYKDVKVFDKTKNSSGIVVFENSWDLGDVQPNEKIDIDYTIVFSADAPDDIYTNSAYASGFNAYNDVVKSPTATSMVKVSSNAEILAGTVNGQSGQGGSGVGGGAPDASGTDGSNQHVGSTWDAVTQSDLPVTAQFANDSSDGVAHDAGLVLGEDTTLIDNSSRKVVAGETARMIGSEVLRNTVGIGTVNAAGLQPDALTSLLTGTGKVSRTSGGVQGSPETVLALRTMISGLLSLMFLLLAILFSRRRKREETKPYITPFWML